MAKSKFWGVTKKAKKTASENQSMDLPKGVEINEELVLKQQTEPPVSMEEVQQLLESLVEEAAVVEEKPVEKPVEVIKSEEPKENVGELFKAYGIAYSEQKKKYVLFTIDYNANSGYTKMVKQEEIADSAPTALNKLNKVLSLKLLKKEEKY